MHRSRLVISLPLILQSECAPSNLNIWQSTADELLSRRWWLVLVCCEIKVPLADWWQVLVWCERKTLLAGCSEQISVHLTAISQPAVLYSTSQPTLFFCSPHNEFNFNLNIPIWRSYCCVLPFVIHPFQQSKRKEKTCSAVSNMLTCQGCKLSYCAGTNNKILTLCRRDLALVWVKYSELYCGLDFFYVLFRLYTLSSTI